MKKLLVVIISALALAGCKVDVNAETNYSDIQSSEHKLIKSDAYFEVSSCNDFDDSRKESDSLTRLKKEVPEIFINAEYIECFDKRMESYAHYKIPMGVGHFDDKSKPLPSEMYIFSEGNTLAGIFMSKELVEKIKAKEKDAMSNFKFNMTLKIKGTGTPISAYVISSYVNAKNGDIYPEAIRKYNWKGVDPLSLTLSNVSVDSMMAYGSVPVLVTSEYFREDK